MKPKTDQMLNIVIKPFGWGLQSKNKYYVVTTIFTGTGWFVFFAALLYNFNALNVWMAIFLVVVCVLAGGCRFGYNMVTLHGKNIVTV